MVPNYRQQFHCSETQAITTNVRITSSFEGARDQCYSPKGTNATRGQLILGWFATLRSNKNARRCSIESNLIQDNFDTTRSIRNVNA
jgi:hypothetical protein